MEEPNGTLQVQVGRPLYVPCLAAAAAELRPTIEWVKLANLEVPKQREPSLKSVGHELRLNSVKPEDAGTYECRASNGLDEDLVARVNVSVLGKYQAKSSR